jgi:polyisoprenoid-binding protein YceI
MKRLILLAAMLSLAATPTFAARWTPDMAKSKLGFSLPWGKEPYVASFKSWNATIDFDAADLARAHVAATIALASVTSGDDDTDDSLRGEEGFGTGQFPTAKFETKSFQHLSGNKYSADGTLTIRGKARPVRMPFILDINGGTAHMVGQVQTRWADYGLGQGMGAQMPDIGPLVTIRIDLTARKS